MFGCGILAVSLLMALAVSCRAPHEVTHDVTDRTEPNLDPGSPRGNPFFTQVCYQEVKGTMPTMQAPNTSTMTSCARTCHEAYAKSFAENVHRGDGCEGCHGPASRHLETQGREPGLIFSFKSGDPVARAEACLRCHEENNCTEGAAGGARSTPIAGDLRRLPPRPLQRAAGNAGHDDAGR